MEQPENKEIPEQKEEPKPEEPLPVEPPKEEQPQEPKEEVKKPEEEPKPMEEEVKPEEKTPEKEKPKKKEKILYNKKKKNLILNDFHSNYFKILKGTDNDKIIRTFFYSENLGNNKYESDIKNKKAKEKKLKLIAPEIIKKKEILMERLPLNYFK